MPQILTVLFFLGLASMGGVAQAQVDVVEVVELDDEAVLDLEDIDRESTLATVGYVLSPLLHVGGLVLLAAGGIALGGLGYGSDGDGELGAAFLVTGGLAALGGLVGLGVSIGLDVDSGSRRRGWHDRHGVSGFALSVTPASGDGLLVRLGGEF